ncbi:hypothetical protein A2304_00810 [Candidatus Uhrbacteria bacterium RIFOXYB2_FULL_57_15]|uniref:ATPase AAA-type core domain-containing protein n=1 Tax=Candidatus Uhrbacteria bacterium RIFOXYB2_FULL_57_15 TaxID=1802422 RepID=A0A1F7W7H1_9BACT|nr:MAG: hypothetical protein A2304_00810 [Candidatus Uhrbacteria bacterium RIFOXYB2_FULL_57_15]OGL99294.1 MAG: hypothetical protein A2501_03980 [Candidatus Uhrbacteria bacterium RIFOXYC12_FULL_57_11]
MSSENMIYLIGGPPRCGKTTLAKSMSKKFGIPWISTDMLEVVSGEYMSRAEWKRAHPYSLLRRTHKTNDAFYGKLSPQEIVRILRRQAMATAPAIDMAAICEINDGNDYVIEGYHIEPGLASRLVNKYGKKNVRAVFLTRHDPNAFARDVKKSTTPNDWLIVGTKREKTFLKVGRMVSHFSDHFETQAKKYRFKVYKMDEDFPTKLVEAADHLRGL